MGFALVKEMFPSTHTVLIEWFDTFGPCASPTKWYNTRPKLIISTPAETCRHRNTPRLGIQGRPLGTSLEQSRTESEFTWFLFGKKCCAQPLRTTGFKWIDLTKNSYIESIWCRRNWTSSRKCRHLKTITYPKDVWKSFLWNRKKLLKQIPSSESPSTSSAAVSVRASFRFGSIMMSLPGQGAVEESRVDFCSANVGLVTC